MSRPRCTIRFAAGLATLCLAGGLAWWALPPSALAFRYAIKFDGDPSNLFEDPAGNLVGGGGGALYFTGSPRAFGLTCAVCHINAPGKIEIGVGSIPAGLFGSPVEGSVSGAYLPSTDYSITISLLNEQFGTELNSDAVCPNVTCNVNIFAFEPLDVLDKPAGILCPGVLDAAGCHDFVDHPTLMGGDGSTILARGFLAEEVGTDFQNGATSWVFQWRSPPAGTGPVTFFIVMVDGGGGQLTTDIPADPLGDDFQAVVIRALEG